MMLDRRMTGAKSCEVVLSECGFLFYDSVLGPILIRPLVIGATSIGRNIAMSNAHFGAFILLEPTIL